MSSIVYTFSNIISHGAESLFSCWMLSHFLPSGSPVFLISQGCAKPNLSVLTSCSSHNFAMNQPQICMSKNVCAWCPTVFDWKQGVSGQFRLPRIEYCLGSVQKDMISVRYSREVRSKWNTRPSNQSAFTRYIYIIILIYIYICMCVSNGPACNLLRR